jgi:hypothetical protein
VKKKTRIKSAKATLGLEYLLGDIVAFHGLDYDTCICEVTEVRKTSPVLTLVDNPCLESHLPLGRTLLPGVVRDRQDVLLYRRES